MEMALFMACLTIIVLLYGFSIERAKTLGGVVKVRV